MWVNSDAYHSADAKMFSDLLRPHHVDLACVDKRSGNVIILAKNEINIEIEPNGEWRFL